MDRRKSLKAIALGTISTGVLLEACKDGKDKPAENGTAAADADKSSNLDRLTGIFFHS